MSPELTTILVSTALGLFLLFGFGMALARFYRQVQQGQVVPALLHLPSWEPLQPEPLPGQGASSSRSPPRS